MEEVKDTYDLVLSELYKGKKDFIDIGIKLISEKMIPADKASDYWGKVKADFEVGSINSKEIYYCRKYGNNPDNIKVQKDFYKKVFKNVEIEIDIQNNVKVRKTLIEKGVVPTDWKNYQYSHVFGMTKNPIIFTMFWNIVFVPKIYDPLTGHETKGEYNKAFKKRLIELIFNTYGDLIKDYNKYILKITKDIDFNSMIKNATSKNEKLCLLALKNDFRILDKKTILENINAEIPMLKNETLKDIK